MHGANWVLNLFAKGNRPADKKNQLQLLAEMCFLSTFQHYFLHFYMGKHFVVDNRIFSYCPLIILTVTVMSFVWSNGPDQIRWCTMWWFPAIRCYLCSCCSYVFVVTSQTWWWWFTGVERFCLSWTVRRVFCSVTAKFCANSLPGKTLAQMSSSSSSTLLHILPYPSTSVSPVRNTASLQLPTPLPGL